MRLSASLVVFFSLGVCNQTVEQPAEPINTVPIHFPATNGGPAQLNAAFANGDCHVRVN